MLRSNFCRAAGALLGLALLAGTALAADLSTEVGQLRAALAQRVAEIGPAPAEKVQKKEAKKLTKAVAALDGYTGANDLADLKRLGKVGKQILKSRTEDAAVVAETSDVLRALGDVVETEAGLAADALAALSDPGNRTKIEKIAVKAEAALGSGLQLIETDPREAHARILGAWTLYGKAGAKGAKLAEKEAIAGPGDTPLPDGLWIYRQYSFGVYFAYVQNDSSKRYYAQDVLLTGTVRDATGEIVLTPDRLSIAGLRPEYFEVTTFPDGSFDAPGLIERVFPDFPVPGRLDLVNYIFELAALLPASSDPYTFEGSITVVISRKKSGGGPLIRTTLTNFGPMTLFAF